MTEAWWDRFKPRQTYHYLEDQRGQNQNQAAGLQGQGSFVENNTRLDIGRPNNLELVEKALEKSVEREVREVVTKLQKQYKVDNVGFGQAIYRSKPKQWKALKSQWDSRFPDVDVAIAVKIDLDGAGMAGPPLQLNPKETIR